MGLRINTNVTALTAQRNLTLADARLFKSVQRLSSGLRINSAKEAETILDSVPSPDPITEPAIKPAIPRI